MQPTWTSGRLENDFRYFYFTGELCPELSPLSTSVFFSHEIVSHLRKTNYVLAAIISCKIFRKEFSEELPLRSLESEDRLVQSVLFLPFFNTSGIVPFFHLCKSTIFSGPNIEGGEKDEISGLPVEIITKIMAYLDVKDLCRCAQVNKQLNKIVYSSVLWRTLRPSNWAKGDWRFGEGLTSEDCNCDCPPNFNMLAYKE